MIIFPAIDLQEGKVVRLLQGKFDQVTEYSDDPIFVAQRWVERGARWLHVVDLDGAKQGRIRNLASIAGIARAVKVPVQVGGGVRSEEDIRRLMEAGAARIILGTRAIEDKEFLKRVLSRWPEKIAVSVDCAQGMVAQKGWTTITRLRDIDFARSLEALGLQYLIYTDIARDGMLTGPNLESLQRLLEAVHISVIASGGISNLEDIKNLLMLQPKGLIGAITGKALYEETLRLEEALAIC